MEDKLHGLSGGLSQTLTDSHSPSIWWATHAGTGKTISNIMHDAQFWYPPSSPLAMQLVVILHLHHSLSHYQCSQHQQEADFLCYLNAHYIGMYYIRSQHHRGNYM